jgi:hypothetical protein
VINRLFYKKGLSGKKNARFQIYSYLSILAYQKTRKMRICLLIGAALIFLSSCTKTYECHCVDGRTIDPKDEHFSINKGNVGDARQKCLEYENILSVNGFNYTCTIDE